MTKKKVTEVISEIKIASNGVPCELLDEPRDITLVNGEQTLPGNYIIVEQIPGQPPVDNEHVAEGATQFTSEEIVLNAKNCKSCGEDHSEAHLYGTPCSDTNRLIIQPGTIDEHGHLVQPHKEPEWF